MPVPFWRRAALALRAAALGLRTVRFGARPFYLLVIFLCFGGIVDFDFYICGTTKLSWSDMGLLKASR